MKRKDTDAEIVLWIHLRELGDFRIEREFRFYRPRRWRFDFALPDMRIAIEIEGGVFTQGRHTRGKGFIGDMEKYNEAVRLGWKVLRFTPSQVLDGSAIAFIRKVLEAV